LVRIQINGDEADSMRTLPLAEAKAQLSRLVDRLAKTEEEILITRNGRPAAVLVSPDEYESWKETQAIRSDREFMAEIRRGVRQLRKGSRLYTLEDLFGES
jgi:antitoxin YefM